MRNEKFEYDAQKQARAGTSAIFRAVIAGYIIYLGWSVLRGVLKGTSPVPVWTGWFVAIVFTGGAVAFLVYTWKTWQQDCKAARIQQESEKLPAEEEAGVKPS